MKRATIWARTTSGSLPFPIKAPILMHTATSGSDSVDSVYYRTVMAYNVYGGDIRINYWSNPNISYLGRNPTGVGTSSSNSAYNALTLNNTAPVVAMFRDRERPGSAYQFDGDAVKCHLVSIGLDR